jgi:ribosomal protein L12E/L44/L45/RPP1/RPP2
VAAFAAEEKPTEDGDVVVGLDGALAARAAGGGADDGEAFGNAGDANVKEAANDDAEEEKEERNHRD